MSVGIYTQWRRCEDGRLAVDLARHLRRRRGVALLTPTATPAALDADLERLLAPAGTPFEAWCAGHDAVVWFCAGRPADVKAARRLGVRSVLVAGCKESDDDVDGLYPLYDVVVAPSEAVAAVLARRHRFGHVVACPWSPAAPVVVKDPRAVPTPPSFYFPAGLARPRVGDLLAVRAVARLLKHTDATATVAVAGWSRRARRLLVRLARAAGARDRLTLQAAPSCAAEADAMHRADCTALASFWDPVAAAALHSLHLGTPILGWDTAVFNEFATDGDGACLVAASGRSTASLSRAFDEALVALALDPRRLAALRAGTAAGLRARRAAFERQWAAVLAVR